MNYYNAVTPIRIKKGVLCLAAMLLLAQLSYAQIDLNAERDRFYQQIDWIKLGIAGMYDPEDEDDDQNQMEEALTRLEMLKKEYDVMVEALEKGDVNTAREKHAIISKELSSISKNAGLRLDAGDIQEIVGSWFEFKVAEISKKEYVPKSLEYIATPGDNVQVKSEKNIKKKEAVPGIDMFTLMLLATMAFVLIVALVIFLIRARKPAYVLTMSATAVLIIILTSLAEAGCVGKQCGEITYIKVTALTDVPTTTGIKPAGTVICDTSQWGFEKCRDDIIINGDFRFRLEVKVKNTSDTVIDPDTGQPYNTIIDGELVYGMWKYGARWYNKQNNTKWNCLYDRVKLLPGEEKTLVADDCYFHYNPHMDCNAPDTTGEGCWQYPRGTTGRGLVCFKADHHLDCKKQAWKTANSHNWSYNMYYRFPDFQGQSVKGAYGVKITSPNPNNCPGNCVYVNVGETVEFQWGVTNYGEVKTKCLKYMLTSASSWLKRLDPSAHYRWSDWFDVDLPPGEHKIFTASITPEIPGHWGIFFRRKNCYNEDCTDCWYNVSNWWPHSSYGVYVRGPYAYLRGLYPPALYFPPSKKVGVKTHLTVATVEGTADFNADFPLITEIYYYKPGLVTKTVHNVSIEQGKVEEVTVEDTLDLEKVLGGYMIMAMIKYDPNLPIPDVPDDKEHIMNSKMAKAGLEGRRPMYKTPAGIKKPACLVCTQYKNGICVNEQNMCAYAFDIKTIPVDFVKFVDFNMPGDDWYYKQEDYYYLKMAINERRTVALKMQNPYTEPVTFTLVSSDPDKAFFVHRSQPNTPTWTAMLPAATSDQYATSTDYNAVFKAPSREGSYFIELKAITKGVEDTIKINMRVIEPQIYIAASCTNCPIGEQDANIMIKIMNIGNVRDIISGIQVNYENGTYVVEVTGDPNNPAYVIPPNGSRTFYFSIPNDKILAVGRSDIEVTLHDLAGSRKAYVMIWRTVKGAAVSEVGESIIVTMLLLTAIMVVVLSITGFGRRAH